MAHRQTRDFGFFQWVVVGFMLAFGILAILSIGAPLVLLGLILLGVMLDRGPRWPAGIGALAGAGLVGIVIGVIGAVASPGLWAASGATLAALSGLTFWYLRCRSEQ
jgi:hypothetical protein